jgi:heat shock protein HslJ
MKKYLLLLAAVTTFIITGCSQIEQRADYPFLDTTWNLVTLENEQVDHPGPRIPHLRFEQDKVSGFDGCNNFFGNYTREDSKLTFGPLASTRMACPHIKELDMEINRALSATTHYRINGNSMDLYNNDALLASFLAAEQE